MHRLSSVVLAFGALSALAPAYAPAPAMATDRTLPMQFELRHETPAANCGDHCRTWISATGAITSDTPRDFQKFIQGRNLKGATIALDSDGGSVLGAIALGREIRALGFSTTVGHTIDDSADKGGVTLSPAADCESMCPFVLLAGVHRMVPDEARLMVHQIWLGDRREDPTAASYSAEDLVLVQRDIGRRAQYTAEMGANGELLNLALRIPPWEPMHVLTRDEMQSAGLDTGAAVPPHAPLLTMASAGTIKMSAPAAAQISESGWAVVDNSGVTSLARRHPLTVQGDEIGSFDLLVACDGSDGYQVSYLEKREGGDARQMSAPVDGVTVRVGHLAVKLKIVSSERQKQPLQIDTFATAPMPAKLLRAFAAVGNHSLVVSTTSGNFSTSIRIGNTGATQNLPSLAASCSSAKTMAKRAELVPESTRGVAPHQ